jgi:FlaG/FlaF family flagellin (archaellin)
MRHTDLSNVTDSSKCNLSNASIVQNNLNFVSIACNYSLRRTHARSSCAGNHTLLHTDKQNQTTNDKGSTTNNNHSANAKGTTTAEVNTYCSLMSKPRNHILLTTAIVDVKNKSGQYVPCRALLDSGSQSHFITE